MFCPYKSNKIISLKFSVHLHGKGNEERNSDTKYRLDNHITGGVTYFAIYALTDSRMQGKPWKRE